MDIDDNDAQDQNLQLVGEGNSKVTPILHSYGLPKFEFDDSLQGHLRFDSLVENEVFLGITSQEDNNWIEEYSRGTGEIQFSSSVVDSSHKNVWSEATSSESVEMLLKSVGQEEKVAEETINEDFDACEPGSLTNSMDPNHNLHENFVQSKVSSDCGPSLAESESPSQETQVSGRELDSVVIGEKVVDKVCDDLHHKANKLSNESSANELQEQPSVSKVVIGEKVVDKECDDIHHKASNIANESSVNKLQEQVSVSEVECENVGPSQNVDASVEQESDHIIKNEENNMCDLTHNSTIIESSNYNVPEEFVDNQTVEGSNPVVEEPSVSLAIESCDMQVDERHDAPVCSIEQSEYNNTSVSASLICSKINEEPNDNMPEESIAVSPNVDCLETQAVEDTDMKLGILDPSKANVGGLSSPFHARSHSVEETGNGDDIKSDMEERTEIIHVSPNSGCIETQAVEDTDMNLASSKSNVGPLSGLFHTQSHFVEETENDVGGDLKSEMGKGTEIINVSQDSVCIETQAVEDTDMKSEILDSSKFDVGAPSGPFHAHSHFVEETENCVKDNTKSEMGEGTEIIHVSPNSECIETQAVEDTDMKSDILDSSKSNVGAVSSPFHADSHSIEETKNGVEGDLKSDACEGTEIINVIETTQAVEDTDMKSETLDSSKSDVGARLSPFHAHSHSVEETKNSVEGDLKSEMGEGTEISNIGETLITSDFSAEMPSEDILNKDESAGNNVLKSQTEDLNGEEIRSLKPDAFFKGQGATFNERHDAALHLDSRDMGVDDVGASDNQKNVEPSSSFEVCEVVIATGQGSEFNVADMTNADSTKNSSPDTLDDVQLPSGAVATAEEVNEDQPRSPILGVSLVHNDNDNDGKMEVGSSKKVTPEVNSTLDCASDGPLPMDENEDGVQLPSGTVDTADDVNEDQPRSPILGASSVRTDNEGKMKVGSSKKLTPEVDSTLDCAIDGPLVEKEDVTDGVERVVHDLAGHCGSPIGNLNASPSKQTREDNKGGLKFSKTVETSFISGNSEAEGVNNADEGGLSVPKELTGEDEVEPLNLAVNTPDEQRASVDLSVLSEHDTTHEVQTEGITVSSDRPRIGGPSVSSDKPQIMSSSETKDIEHSQSVKGNQEATQGFILENFPVSKESCEQDGFQPVSVSSSSPTKEEKSFTFEVNANAGQSLSPAMNTKESSSISAANESCATQSNPVKLHEHTVVSSETPISLPNEAVTKKTSDRKPRRKSVVKESSKKGTQSKETTPTRRSKAEKPHASLTHPPATGDVTPAKDSKPNEGIECSNSKSLNVPDLNKSTSLLQQSFTDNQQMQLRAQILVYGSLISGAPPDEPHMVVAFGQSDGGRRTWEAAWHACLERVRAQKSIVNNPSTPMQSRSGNKDSDQEIKLGSSQSKFISSPNVSPMIPISSPLWNISTPSDAMQANAMPKGGVLDYRQTLSPMLPYQTLQVPGHNPSWLSQGPFPGQWVANSPVTPFSARFSALPITESVKLTTVKESGGPGIPVIPVNPGAGPTISPVPSSLSSINNPTVSSGQPSGNSKSRKRKKAPASQIEVASQSTPVAHIPFASHTENYNQISFPSQNQTNSGTALVVTSQPLSSTPFVTPVPVISKPSAGQISFPDENIPKTVRREEIVSQIEQSKVQATDAAVQAATAISHCQTVWSQLAMQKNSGLVSDDEAKLASSAVTIAAASSVAKVAAAAAKIASNVAEQARLMADEVFQSSRIGSHDQSIVVSQDKSTSIISTAREAARRRIEAASVASKHAENLDAIVKAAELAAEAVSQAGKIVTMGNPSALTKLIEAGPEGYWKTNQSSNQQVYSDKRNVQTTPNDKDIHTLKHGLSPQEKFEDLAKNQMVIVDGISGSGRSSQNDRSTTGQKGPTLSKTVGGIPGPVFRSDGNLDRDQIVPQSTSGSWKENIIEGSFVEVYKDDSKNVGGWFAANILTLKDGKAFVRYTEIQSDDGSGKLQEWVPLEVEGTKAPRIRIAHRMTTMHFDGTRKRGRTALSDNTWCSGDRVDVWVHDRWREAVVVETDKNDATSLTVQFPGQEKTSVARSWHVRPTLMWKDGKWSEWSSLKGHRSTEGDTPHEKRQKFGTPVVEGKEKGNISSIVIDLNEAGRHKESKILPSSGQGTLFDVGKSSKNENKLNTHKTTKISTQKERSRVVFGVPKPGKKQKFVNVSTHYVADGSNINNTPNDSDKVHSKNDTKEKQVAAVKSKIHQPRKPPIPSLRPVTSKDKSKTNNATSHEASLSDKNVPGSVGDDENISGHENRMDLGSSSNTEDVEKPLTSKARLNKRKVAHVERKTTKIEVKDKSTSEAEPRRSVRKIQPTSRLLEGLQSQLTISKMPTVSHASQRSHNKVTSKGSTNSG
ncbi:uncharacterized protein [Rutidosis leptorrhynchoides]|uniref:uncharacterized protein isoform X2 n=1 Tax=Rutidosis leptorrhynchoides TaxID=125765 RepID=UPI003A9968AF